MNNKRIYVELYKPSVCDWQKLFIDLLAQI
jgi:hypothetical protein